jgi:hypothetical protein
MLVFARLRGEGRRRFLGALGSIGSVSEFTSSLAADVLAEGDATANASDAEEVALGRAEDVAAMISDAPWERCIWLPP